MAMLNNQMVWDDDDYYIPFMDIDVYIYIPFIIQGGAPPVMCVGL